MNEKRAHSQETLIVTSFKDLSDPRRKIKGNFRYPLTEIIFLVISAVISNSDDWTSIATFGKTQLPWLRKFFPYENGTPSHDTLGELFAAIDHEEFSRCFANWITTIVNVCDGEIVAIDGKRLCGSYDKNSNKAAIHMVSAFAVENGICLGQVATDEKSNEITAIPKLLEMLAIKGATVTIDAMGCQKEIVKQVKKAEAEYVIAVKENQKELLGQVKKMFDINKGDTSEWLDSGHGRIETRKCTAVDNLKFFDDKEDWEGLKSVAKVQTERIDKQSGKIQQEVRYYITSHIADAEKLNHAIRKHWGIENQLHWVLDVVFNEDNSRRRKDNSASNFNIINKTALAILKKSDEDKKSFAQKRYTAALSTDYRESILNNV